MSGQAISLATKGVICKPKDIIRNFVIPLNLSISSNNQTINLVRNDEFKLNLSTFKENISIENEGYKLNILTNKPSLNLRTCE